MSDLVLHERRGDFRTYIHTPTGLMITIKVCLQAWVYAHTGYYIALGNGFADNDPLLRTSFSSGKRAAMAAVKAMVVRHA